MHASHRMGMENQTFMKAAAIGTWLGDFVTAWMVTDMMLQVNNCQIKSHVCHVTRHAEHDIFLVSRESVIFTIFPS